MDWTGIFLKYQVIRMKKVTRVYENYNREVKIDGERGSYNVDYNIKIKESGWNWERARERPEQSLVLNKGWLTGMTNISMIDKSYKVK